MRTLQFQWAIGVVGAVLLIPVAAPAEVTRVEITSRTDVMNGATHGASGAYEQIVGRIYFTIHPGNERNRVIADLDLAPKNAAGKIEMSADLKIPKPKEPEKGSGAVLSRLTAWK
jgi:hypothetical protein